MKLRKNIVSITTDHNGNVTSETADYIGVESFAREIYKLYHECMDDYKDEEGFEQYVYDLFGENYLHELAWEFACEANEDMKTYLHRENHRMDGNFANVEEDYAEYRTGTYWVSEYDGTADEYFAFFPNMVARLDNAEDNERANDDREFLSSWFFRAFGTYNIKYNFSNDLGEILYMMEEEKEEYEIA